ncbi:hypothetical protein M3Y99_01448900 [Aphelenchoides fujianensis]|nr:hypothetical protein M3Y99_01448900 [Aphelenchoides fujianensis]
MSARLPQKPLVQAPVRKVVSAPSSVLANANDNLSIDSTANGNERIALEVRPRTLAFGFVDLEERHCAQISIQQSLRPARLEDTCTFTIDSQSSHKLKGLLHAAPQTHAVNLLFPHGLSSLLPQQNTRSPSSQSTSSTPRAVNGEKSLRLEVIWGEERQRQRLKTHFTYGGDEYKKIQGIDFTRHEFVDEGRETEHKLTGSYDIDAFAAGLRWTSIKFIDDHVPVVVQTPVQTPARVPRPVRSARRTERCAPSMRAGHENTRTPERRVDNTMHRTKSATSQRTN